MPAVLVFAVFLAAIALAVPIGIAMVRAPYPRLCLPGQGVVLLS